MAKVLIAMGILMLGVVCLQILFACARPKKNPQSENRVDPNEDTKRYAGKHVMTDGFGGPVLFWGDTAEELFTDVAAVDEEIRERLVYASPDR